MSQSKVDPIEHIVSNALARTGIPFIPADTEPERLDFKIQTDPPVFVEVKQFHSDRIAEQMKRAENVIAIQGIDAAKLFFVMLDTSHDMLAALKHVLDSDDANTSLLAVQDAIRRAETLAGRTP